MGVKLKDLVEPQKIELEDLSGKVIAMDALNALYQFLATIRQPDGQPLIDSRGRITSHLSGLFYRTINLLEHGVKPVYVFDGEPPMLKREEIEERRRRREEALKKWREALERGDLEEARKYAQASASVTDEMIEDAKKLLEAMGIPYVQAPSEGEAQAAYMARKGDVWAVGSQDYDSLLFNAPRLVRNLNITGKRKLPGKDVYVRITPELIELDPLLKKLGITREQLVDIAILLGTDFNEGVKGVGPKTALRIIKTYGSLREAVRRGRVKVDAPFEEIRGIFLKPKVTDEYTIRWGEPDEEAIKRILVDEHDFSEKRVEKAVQRLKKAVSSISQTGLEAWF